MDENKILNVDGTEVTEDALNELTNGKGEDEDE